MSCEGVYGNHTIPLWLSGISSFDFCIQQKLCRQVVLPERLSGNVISHLLFRKSGEIGLSRFVTCWSVADRSVF